MEGRIIVKDRVLRSGRLEYPTEPEVTLNLSEDAKEFDEPPVAYPGAPLDSERARQPPLPDAPYKPYADKRAPAEAPYEPYADRPTAPPQAPYRPYKGI